MLLAALKVSELSLMISVGQPLCDMNLRNASRNSSVDMSLNSSRCTARVTRHVNRQSQTFCWSLSVLTNIGPR